MECIKREGKKISDRFFTEREQQYLKNIGEKKQEKQWREEFIKIWTRKESFVKAIGLGLSFGIRNSIYFLLTCQRHTLIILFKNFQF